MNQTENFIATSLCVDKILQNNVNSTYYARNNAYYAGIMLNAFPYLLCQNLCQLIDSSLI